MNDCDKLTSGSMFYLPEIYIVYDTTTLKSKILPHGKDQPSGQSEEKGQKNSSFSFPTFTVSSINYEDKPYQSLPFA